MSSRAMTRVAHTRWVIVGYVATGLLVALALQRVLLSGTDPANTSAEGYLPLAYVAAAVLAAAFAIGAFVRRADVRLGRGFPWLVGAVSAVVSLVPWWAVFAGSPSMGAAIYRGLRVPQGIVQFWDLLLPLQSVTCASVGVDVYAENNGCLQDPTIYGPGVLWLRFVPFGLSSEKNVQGLGVGMIVISSLALLWLARNSSGLGQIVLLLAAVGGPWLLLLERGNLDAVVIWVAIAAVVLVRRWNSLWAWTLAAALMWLMGTWKYYPFALGLMLIPSLRLRRGWLVLVGYAVATIAFMVITWQTFLFSSQSNSNMTDFGDFVVLGRTPVVARMLGTVVGAGGIQFGDAILFALGLVAAGWGVATALGTRRHLVHPAMLASAGGALFLAGVLVAGFGWGYKAAFLLLAVPLLAALVSSRSRPQVASAVLVLILTGISAVVVWNTVLATLAGVVVAAFAFGLGTTLLIRSIVDHRRQAVVAA